MLQKASSPIAFEVTSAHECGIYICDIREILDYLHEPYSQESGRNKRKKKYTIRDKSINEPPEITNSMLRQEIVLLILSKIIGAKNRRDKLFSEYQAVQKAQKENAFTWSIFGGHAKYVVVSMFNEGYGYFFCKTCLEKYTRKDIVIFDWQGFSLGGEEYTCTRDHILIRIPTRWFPAGTNFPVTRVKR